MTWCMCLALHPASYSLWIVPKTKGSAKLQPNMLFGNLFKVLKIQWKSAICPMDISLVFNHSLDKLLSQMYKPPECMWNFTFIVLLKSDEVIMIHVNICKNIYPSIRNWFKWYYSCNHAKNNSDVVDWPISIKVGMPAGHGYRFIIIMCLPLFPPYRLV